MLGLAATGSKEAVITRRYFDIQRRVVAHKTTEAWQEKPHGAVTLDLDVTPVIALVKDLRQRPEYVGVEVTMNSVILKIIAEGLRESPEMNAHTWYNPRSGLGELIMFDEINIATPM